jgi:hypothetical protein
VDVWLRCKHTAWLWRFEIEGLGISKGGRGCCE